MSQYTQKSQRTIQSERPAEIGRKVRMSLLEYSESSFTDPHSVVSLDEPEFDPAAFSHIGKIYEGVEPHRMGGHAVVRTEEESKKCVHHFDPNHRDYFIVRLAKRTMLDTLCVSTRFFAGNPACDLKVTLIDDVRNDELTIPIPHLQPDSEHWLEQIQFHTTRMVFRFKAGGITRVWAFGEESNKQPNPLVWLSKNSCVVFKEDDFFGGPDYALSDKADRSTPHMLGWETSRSAMGLQAVFPIRKGRVKEVVIDTYRHVNNYLRSAWVFSANFPDDIVLDKEGCPLWQVTSSSDEQWTTHELKAFFEALPQDKVIGFSFDIEPLANTQWTLETTFELQKDAMHIQSELDFDASHICIMFLPHGGLHAIKVMGEPY
ncbi:MAG: hypothetical protein VXZ96_05520 [Myxococcota bacterium]|nr:hypothetical protein [Myxococcota bacterium]